MAVEVDIVDFPAGLVFQTMMVSAQQREIVEARLAAVFSGDCVIDIATLHQSPTARKGATFVAIPHSSGEVSGHAIDDTVKVENRACNRLGENSKEGRRVPGKFPGGLSIDRAVAFEAPRIL